MAKISPSPNLPEARTPDMVRVRDPEPLNPPLPLPGQPEKEASTASPAVCHAHALNIAYQPLD